MGTSIEETIHFQVTVHAVEREGHWVARTLETAIFGYGETREAAERSAADANVLIVQELKRQGSAALDAFMRKYGIEYSTGVEPGPAGSGGPERLKRAA